MSEIRLSKFGKHNMVRRKLKMSWLYYGWSWLIDPEFMRKIYKLFQII